jgi:hypothetical protein
VIANGLPSILWWASDYQRKLKGQFRKRAICQKHSWQWIHARTRLFKVTVTVPIVLSKGCCQRQYWLSWRGSKCWWGFPSVFSHQALFADLVTFGSSLAVSFSSSDALFKKLFRFADLWRRTIELTLLSTWCGSRSLRCWFFWFYFQFSFVL